jgi:hypothetical protein
MTSMPTIDDRMVLQFRRTGKRRSSYSAPGSGDLARVVPQRRHRCIPGNPCITVHGALGICDANGHCVEDFPDFRL